MDIASQLSEIIPSARVHTRLIDRIAYANDASYFRLVPQAVVQPNSISEIQSLFKFTQQNKIPMTFRAAGTSLSGQAVTDGILVDISKHWGKYSIEDDAKHIRFQRFDLRLDSLCRGQIHLVKQMSSNVSCDMNFL